MHFQICATDLSVARAIRAPPINSNFAIHHVSPICTGTLASPWHLMYHCGRRTLHLAPMSTLMSFFKIIHKSMFVPGTAHLILQSFGWSSTYQKNNVPASSYVEMYVPCNPMLLHSGPFSQLVKQKPTHALSLPKQASWWSNCPVSHAFVSLH